MVGGCAGSYGGFCVMSDGMGGGGDGNVIELGNKYNMIPFE